MLQAVKELQKAISLKLSSMMYSIQGMRNWQVKSSSGRVDRMGAYHDANVSQTR